MEAYEVEDLFLLFLKTLPIPDQKNIHNGQDILNALTYDSEEELKNEIWNIIKYSTNYLRIAKTLQDDLKIRIPDDEEEDPEDENQEESSDEE